MLELNYGKFMKNKFIIFIHDLFEIESKYFILKKLFLSSIILILLVVVVENYYNLTSYEMQQSSTYEKILEKINKSDISKRENLYLFLEYEKKVRSFEIQMSDTKIKLFFIMVLTLISIFLLLNTSNKDEIYIETRSISLKAPFVGTVIAFIFIVFAFIIYSYETIDNTEKTNTIGKNSINPKTTLKNLEEIKKQFNLKE